MSANVSVKIAGIDELKRALAALPAKIRRKALVKALRAGGKAVQKAARAATPVLAGEALYRTKGLLRKKLTVRVSKESRRAGNVGVFVNIKPASRGDAGAKSKLDPYYWRFVAFGTKAHTIKPKTARGLAFGGRIVNQVRHPGTLGKNFLQAGADALPQALTAFEREAVPAIEALNKRGA